VGNVANGNFRETKKNRQTEGGCPGEVVPRVGPKKGQKESERDHNQGEKGKRQGDREEKRLMAALPTNRKLAKAARKPGIEGKRPRSGGGVLR